MRRGLFVFLACMAVGLLATRLLAPGRPATALTASATSGAAVSSVHYTIDGSTPNALDAVNFTLQNAVPGQPGTFGVSLDPAGASAPEYTCSMASGNSSGSAWTCPTNSPTPASVRNATLLTVFEAGSGCAGCSLTISKTVNLGDPGDQGSLAVKVGDFIAAGFALNIPGLPSSNTVNVTLSNISVTLPYTCAAGGSGTIAVPFPQTSYTYAYTGNAGNSWLPTSSTADPSSYQTSPPPGIHAPNGCTGKTMQNSSATFQATLSWDVFLPSGMHPLVYFHYRVPDAIGQGNVNCANSGQNPSPGSQTVCGAAWSTAVDP